MQKHHNKPKNWQDFEVLCKNLWKLEFSCHDINRHGRQGQKQHGVDIYGYINNGNEIFGIQCKGKDEYNHSQITKSEIDAEINKAITFTPSLSLFIFATTSSRDEKIQEYIRIKDQEFFNSHKMHISIKFWDCIEELLEYHKDVLNWYENTFTHFYDIEVKAIVQNSILTPRYNNVTRIYKTYSADLYKLGISPFLMPQTITDIFHQRPYKNHTWCEFDIKLSNIGDSVLEDYSLDLNFDESEVRAISNMNDVFTNDPFDIESNKLKSEQMELFHYKDDDFSLIFEPKDRVLVQKNRKICKIGLFPKYTAKEIHIKWTLIARDFHKKGTLIIPIKPTFIDVTEKEYVLSCNDERIENCIEEGIEYLDQKDNLFL